MSINLQDDAFDRGRGDVREAAHRLRHARDRADHRVTGFLETGWPGLAADAFTLASDDWRAASSRHRARGGRDGRADGPPRSGTSTRRTTRRGRASTRWPPDRGSARPMSAPDDFVIEVDELEDVVGDLEACERQLTQLVEDLERQMVALRRLGGLAATAQHEAHEEWSRGMTAMHAALADLRAAARLAHDHSPGCRDQRRDVAAGDVRIAVVGGGYGSAAGALRVGNELAAQQYGTLTHKLAAYAGMAGDDCASRELRRGTTPRRRRRSTVSTTWSTPSRPSRDSPASRTATTGMPTRRRRTVTRPRTLTASTSRTAPSTSARCGWRARWARTPPTYPSLERDPRPPRGVRLAGRRHRPAARRGGYVVVGRFRGGGARVVLRHRGGPARDPGVARGTAGGPGRAGPRGAPSWTSRRRCGRSATPARSTPPASRSTARSSAASSPTWPSRPASASWPARSSASSPSAAGPRPVGPSPVGGSPPPRRRSSPRSVPSTTWRASGPPLG